MASPKRRHTYGLSSISQTRLRPTEVPGRRSRATFCEFINVDILNIVMRSIHTFLFINLLLLILLLAGCSETGNLPLKIGDKAPLFSAKDINGNPISLSGYSGRPLVIRFFLTDCKFCEADTPVFNRYYDKHKSKGLGMIYINSTAEDDRKVTDFAELLAIPFPVIIDQGKTIADSYQIKALPQTIILSPDHTIKAAMLGGVSEEELDSELRGYFK